MRKLYLFIGVLAIAAFTGCQDSVVSADNEAALSSEATQAADVLSKVGFGRIWADGELFGTVGTPTSLPDEQGPFDILFQGNFKDGVRAISESKPGDQDWNGGRWEIWVLKTDVGSKYAMADEDSDLDINDFAPNGVYLECPLTPRRGASGSN